MARRSSHPTRAARAKAIKLGNPLDPTTEMGTAANEPQFKTIMGFIDSAKSEGARLVTGGEPAREGELAKGLFVKRRCCREISGHFIEREGHGANTEQASNDILRLDFYSRIGSPECRASLPRKPRRSILRYREIGPLNFHKMAPRGRKGVEYNTNAIAISRLSKHDINR
jgi:hypothetical protein